MRINVDAMFLTEPRARRLAQLLGINVYEVRGRILEVWALGYHRVTNVLPLDDIDGAADLAGYAEAMIGAKLADRTTKGAVRVRGLAKRIKYLEGQAERGRKGGLAKAKRQSSERQPNAKQRRSPPDPDLDLPPDPDPDPEREAAPASSPAAPAPLQLVPPGRKAKKPAAGRKAPPPYPDADPEPTIPDREHAARAEYQQLGRGGVPVDLEWRRMLDYHRTQGRGSWDWRASWRTWCSRWSPARAPAGAAAAATPPTSAQLERRAQLERESEARIQRERDEITRKAEAAEAARLERQLDAERDDDREEP